MAKIKIQISEQKDKNLRVLIDTVNHYSQIPYLQNCLLAKIYL